MSAVLCLPACLCVCVAASRGQAPPRERGCGVPPWAPRPTRGGAGPPPPWHASGCPRAGEGEGGGGEGEVPRSPYLVPWRRSLAVAGGRPGCPGPGGPAANRHGALFSCPPPSLGPDRCAGPHPGPPLSLLPPRGAGWPGGGGGGGCWGRRFGSAVRVSGLRGSGPPSAFVAPALSLTGGDARPPAAPYGGGVGGCALGWGARPSWGGCPAALCLLNPLAPITWDGRARPSPASPLAWGLGWRRRWVLPAVAPVGEGVAQGPGERVVGLRIRDAEHRPSLQESRPRRLPVGPPCPNHRAEDPLVVLWGRPAPRGHLLVPLLPPEEHGIKGRIPHPPGGP